jgi:hypothetical protein
MHRLVQPAYWLLEVLFGAQHGTVLGYRRDVSGDVDAVLHDYDDNGPNALVAKAVQASAFRFAENGSRSSTDWVHLSQWNWRSIDTEGSWNVPRMQKRVSSAISSTLAA